jgi:hypothetical protein
VDVSCFWVVVLLTPQTASPHNKTVADRRLQKLAPFIRPIRVTLATSSDSMGAQDQALAIKNELCYYRDKQGIKGLGRPFPLHPKSPPKLLRFAPEPPCRAHSLTKPNTSMHNQHASVASLRGLFAFTGMPFGFPLESPFTSTGIPTTATLWQSS